eukprot:6236068-Amphidinium_carterae.2
MTQPRLKKVNRKVSGPIHPAKRLFVGSDSNLYASNTTIQAVIACGIQATVEVEPSSVYAPHNDVHYGCHL